MCDENPLRLYGVAHDGCVVKVEGPWACGAGAPYESPPAAPSDEFAFRVPVGGNIASGAESGSSIAESLKVTADEFDESTGKLLQLVVFTVTDGCNTALSHQRHLELRKEEAGNSEGVTGGTGVVGCICMCHITNDAFLEVCTKASVPCPVWARSSHNSVFVYLLEQMSNYLHNNADLLKGINDLAVLCPQGMEVRWASYARVAGFLAGHQPLIVECVQKALKSRGAVTCRSG